MYVMNSTLEILTATWHFHCSSVGGGTDLSALVLHCNHLEEKNKTLSFCPFKYKSTCCLLQ